MDELIILELSFFYLTLRINQAGNSTPESPETIYSIA